ncbi:MAG: FHA domain-containing protein [Planctomycetota bacterium]|nr:FHA domain-containing protein [Planctomycetota bacterium]
MADLVVLSHGKKQDVLLGEGRRWTIGRADDCQVFLNDLGISRKHCAIIKEDADYFIEDIGSSTGTFLKGKRITSRQSLRNGDRIKIGGISLIFRETASPNPPLPATRTPEVTLVGQSGPPPLPSSVPEPRNIAFKSRMVIGRDAACDLVLQSPEVSRFHAELTLQNNQLALRDLNSSNGTFLNGSPVAGRMPLSNRGRIRVGSFILLIQESGVEIRPEQNNVRLSAIELSRTVTSRDTGGALKLLDNISLVVQPREFVALLGPSGSGKSTLMDALNGRRPASRGQVLVNEDDFYANYRYFKTSIAYVPQSDIVHPALTVYEAHYFAARLRLPADTTEKEISGRIEKVLNTLALKERQHTQISNLSGGQVKRVSLGVELLSDPSLVFLDEATSGLDAGTEARMMTLFRHLAHEGKSVICITHNVENVIKCDLVAILTKGVLAFYGPPAAAAQYFAVDHLAHIYDKLESKPAEIWAEKFNASPFHTRYVSSRLISQPRRESHTPAKQTSDVKQEMAANLRQVPVFLHRMSKLIIRDPKNLAILLGQAPVIAGLIALVFGTQKMESTAQKIAPHVKACFLMSISAIWFGCTNSAKEIVKELPVYLRERAINLRLPAYLFSKILLLSLLSFFQCLVLVLVVSPALELEGDLARRLVTLFMTSVSGLAMGLTISAIVNNNDKAMSIVPLVLIPQVILAGAIIKLTSAIDEIASLTIISYWSYDSLLFTLSKEVRGAIPSELHDMSAGSWADGVLVLSIFVCILALLCTTALKRKDVLS